MKIVPTFGTQNNREGLFAIHLDNEEEDELAKCVENWLFDTGYLYNFFSEHINDLNSGYYEKPISIQQAIKYTREEAEALFQALGDLAVTGINDGIENLSSVFAPLNNYEYRLKELQQVKAKSKNQMRWLRIYAIKISSNTFIVTGGAIKLVEKMRESSHLIKENQKLDDIKNFLKEEGIFDQEEFEVYILSL